MRALIVVGGIHAWSYQRNRHISARTQERASVGTVMRVNIHLVRDFMLIGQLSEPLRQPVMIRDRWNL